jgi:hypothetical protein
VRIRSSGERIHTVVLGAAPTSIASLSRRCFCFPPSMPRMPMFWVVATLQSQRGEALRSCQMDAFQLTSGPAKPAKPAPLICTCVVLPHSGATQLPTPFTPNCLPPLLLTETSPTCLDRGDGNRGSPRQALETSICLQSQPSGWIHFNQTPRSKRVVPLRDPSR